MNGNENITPTGKDERGEENKNNTRKLRNIMAEHNLINVFQHEMNS